MSRNSPLWILATILAGTTGSPSPTMNGVVGGRFAGGGHVASVVPSSSSSTALPSFVSIRGSDS